MNQNSLSGFHYHSLGVVAANKSLSSNEIEVTLVEILSMQDGKVSDYAEKFEAKGSDSNGSEYNLSVAQGTTVPAKWLQFGSNRTTAPDVRRGEQVIVYRYKDTTNYFWEPLNDGLKYRRLETAIFAFSATQDETAVLSAENCYFVEISTHKGLLHIGTSQANGEAVKYDIQLNTKEGFFKLVDSVGNFFSLDSPAETFETNTSSGCNFKMEKIDMTATVPGNTTVITTGDTTVKTTGNVNIFTTGINTIKGAVNKIIGKILLMGPVSVTSEDGSSPGKMKMLGDIEHEGNTVQTGDLKVNNISANVVQGNQGVFPNLD